MCRWLKVRELMSALAVDFESLLVDGKLDRYAMQDCASFLGLAVGKKRDRNVNMWAILLYYMLNINFLFQGCAESQEQVFEWMLKSVTQAAHEHNNHHSVLERFVISVASIRADDSSTARNPLGPMDRTIFWHNLRTTDFHVYLLIEPCIAVVKNVLGKTFREGEIFEAVQSSAWASKSRYYFYDTSSNPWPICRMVYNSESMSNSPTPLGQQDLNDETLAQMKCVSFSLAEWNRIVNSMSKGATLDCDYTKIVITSSVPDVGKYNFFQTVSGNNPDSGWFGYRILGHCTFAKFCGAHNCLNMGTREVMGTTDLILEREVVELNRAKGFPPVEDLYLPSRMLETFNYDPCNVHSRDMPLAYIMNPFTARDGEEDEPLRVPHYSFGPTNSSPQKRKAGIDDNQSNGDSDSPLPGGFPGSSPLQDITNRGRDSPRESHADPRPVKRRRVIADEDDDEQARPPIPYLL